MLIITMRYEIDSDNALNTVEVSSFIAAYELVLDPYHYCDVFLYSRSEEKLYFVDRSWMNPQKSSEQVLFKQAPL